MNELVDIIDPAPPAAAASTSITWFVACAVLLALLVAIAMWWRHNAARRRAMRRVRRLRREVARGGISAREIAYRVAADLRVGLRTPRLRAGAAPVADSPKDQQAWRELVARLDKLRYQPGAQLDATQIDLLLRDGASWLRRMR